MILGIDLGTTYSAAAMMDDKGEPHIIQNKEGDNTTPSVVLIDNDEVMVGKNAKERAVFKPDNTRALMKLHMGEKVTLLEQNGEKYTPEALSAFVLQKLIKDACDRTGSNPTDTQVVVTVPAYFSEHQREATKQAVEIAGAQFLSSIDEPTAAALYYSRVSGINDGTVLVYDFGGGTFDATLIDVKAGKIDIIGKNGVHNAGGSDFDVAITDYIVNEFKARTGLDISLDEYKDVYQEVLIKAENVKKSLSSVKTASVLIRAGAFKEEIEVTRSLLEEIVEPVYLRTESAVTELFYETGFNKDKLSIVLLVGGSSQIPYVREKLGELLGQSKILSDIDPAEAVAMGAALYSAMSVKEQIMTDVCSHGIGIKLAKDNAGNMEYYNKTIICKNTKIPTSVEHTFYTIRQGENIQCTFTEPLFDDEENLEFCIEIGSIDVDPPTELKAGTKVVINVNLNAHQLLEGYVYIQELNYKKPFEIRRKNNLSKEEVRKMTALLQNKTEDKTEGKSEDKAETKQEAKASKKSETKQEVTPEDKSENTKAVNSKKVDKPSHNVDSVIADYFQGIVGMKSVQEKMSTLYHTLELEDARKAAGKKRVLIPWNFFIAGENGSGKSMVTDIICKILYQFGMTDAEEPVEIKLDSEKNIIDQLFAKNEDNKVYVYLVDHAELLFEEYVNVDSDENEQKTKTDEFFYELEDNLKKTIKAGNRFFIFSGDFNVLSSVYEQKERIHNQIELIKIPEYSIDELVEIARLISPVDISEDAEDKLRMLIKCEMGSLNFSNVITIQSIIQEAFKHMADRHSKGGGIAKLEAEDFASNDDSTETLEELEQQLYEMIGLATVKEEVKAQIANIKDRERRRKAGEPVPEINNHLRLLGAPGTGKTTVAELLGKIYGKLGVIAKPDVFVEIGGGDFKAKYVGHTTANTRKIIESAMGGVLFIDEAYGMCSENDDNFGREVMTELVKLSDQYKHRMVIMMAGYEKEMKDLMKLNPGMERRFPNVLHFENYTDDELFEIYKYTSSSPRRGFCMNLDKGAEKRVRELIASEKKRIEDFGNAGGVDNIVSFLYTIKNLRESGMGDTKSKKKYEKNTIYAEDVDAYIEKYVKDGSGKPAGTIDPEEELENLVGMQVVKNHIRETIGRLELDKERAEAEGAEKAITKCHLVLVGNPGTGKTTVARIIARIYAKHGLIKSADKFVELGGLQLKGAVIGKAQENVDKAIERAMGGVLFLDEIYALQPEGAQMDSFAQEVRDSLLKQIEDHKGDIVVIMAGYKDKTMKFLAGNEGLKSRMNTIIEIPDYSTDELTEIFYRMAANRKDRHGRRLRGFALSEDLRPVIREKIQERYDNSTEYGNARDIENYFSDVITRQSNRLMSKKKESEISSDELFTILEEDL